MSDAVVSAAFGALGTTAEVFVTDARRLDTARAVLAEELARVDLALSRFRRDSELSLVNHSAGHPVEVSPLTLEAVSSALRAARLTDGDVDPTVGKALRAIGYDRDFGSLPAASLEAIQVARAPGWTAVRLDAGSATITVPRGVELDLGSTGKAFATDLAAAAVHRAIGAGTLVNLGGDIATTGRPPSGGWRVRISDDHRDTSGTGPAVAVRAGGLATSSTTVREWTRAGRSLHHIVDPKTGQPAPVVWRTVSVAAASCLDANTASTAAIVRGEGAERWLESLGLPSRLVRADGSVVYCAGWPSEAG